jgi:hypothetical protein
LGLIITPFFSYWLLKEENSFEYIRVFKNKEDAVIEASNMAMQKKTELTVFSTDAIVESSISYK